MFKKKISIGLIALLILLTLTGCNKTSKIAGRWSATFYMTIADTAVKGEYVMTINDDGSYAISQTADEESRRALINVYIEKTKATLKEKKTASEIQTLMSQAGVSTEDELVTTLLMKSAKDKNYTSVDAYVFGINGYEFKTIANGTCKLKGKKLNFANSAGDKIKLTGVYDKGDQDITLKLGDNEVIFNPVELDK